jgi:hypothetical protein|tara:strand:+ start:571 stop:762 length:192 start_codon:yes stop_codon:yes gene_type:complete
MNDKYTIKTEEEYDAVQIRLNILWDRVEEITKLPYPNIGEIIKLESACALWDKKKIEYGFFDD